MKRLHLGILLIVVLVTALVLSGGGGVSVQCNNTNGCIVAASSSLSAIAIGLIVFLGIMVIPRKEAITTEDNVGFLRKISATFIDMLFVIAGFSAILALPMLIVESIYVGVFEWSFFRDYLRPTDWALAVPAVLGAFMIIAYLRLRAYVKGLSSLGQYLMGYEVVVIEEKRTYKLAFKRLSWSLLFLSLWPFYLIYKKIKKLDNDLWDIKVGAESKKIKYS